MPVSRQLKEIASWRIATELIRRHPTKLALIETHPGGGQYDCLTVIKRQLGPDRSAIGLLDMNRMGSVHVHRAYDRELPEPMRWGDFWSEMTEVDDPKLLLDRVEQALGLSHRGKPPISKGEVLAYRVISALLSTTAYGRVRWECRNGYVDSSGGDGGPRGDYFAEFPVTLAWLEKTPEMPFGIPQYGFWFLVRDEDPLLCFHVTGQVTDHIGNAHALVPLYQSYGRILPMAIKVAGTALR